MPPSASRRELAAERRAVNRRPQPLVLCVDDPENGHHTWRGVGLDSVDGVLSNVRICLRCDRSQHKPYGRAGAWRDTST